MQRLGAHSLVLGSRWYPVCTPLLITSSARRWLSVQGFPRAGGGDDIGKSTHPDIYPPGVRPRDPGDVPQRDPDLYPPISDQPDTDRLKRDVNPDLFPPRFPSPDTNPADNPHVPEPPTPGVDVPTCGVKEGRRPSMKSYNR